MNSGILRKGITMGLLTQFRGVCDRVIAWSYSVGEMRIEKQKMKDPRRKKIVESVQLTREQQEEIDAFYTENFGRKVPYDWHRLYQAFTGNFDKKYFPEYIFSSRIERVWNPRMYAEALADKNLLFVFTEGLEGVRIPSVFLSRVSGLYRNGAIEPLPRQKALESIWNLGEAVIKPTVDSGSGKDVRFIKIENGIDSFSGKSVDAVIEAYEGDFNIQECIRNHSVLTELYPGSVNTFRIVTYIWENAIHHLPVALRIGQGGNRVDNAHAGGLFVSCSDEGALGACGYTEFLDRFPSHPDTHTVFEGYRIPQVPRILEAAYKMHARVPQLKVLSWDLTLDEQGNIVLIEVNTLGQAVWLSQMISGRGAFGENTEGILREFGGKRKNH